MRLSGRFSALAGRHRHVPGTDLVSATRGVPVTDGRPVLLRHQPPPRRPLGARLAGACDIDRRCGRVDRLQLGAGRQHRAAAGPELPVLDRDLLRVADRSRRPAPHAAPHRPRDGSRGPGARLARLPLSRCSAGAAVRHADRPGRLRAPCPGSTHVVIDRLPAADQAHRLGSLVFDPGGPGGSGTQLVAREALGLRLFSSGVRDDYDLIGYDPRGVGLSEPIRCSAALFNRPIDYFPQTRSAFRRLVAHNRALGRSCERDSGPLAAHDDTISVARDLDAVRAALGEPTLNYLGLSYGTEIDGSRHSGKQTRRERARR